MPADFERRIITLEEQLRKSNERVTALEADRDHFLAALKGAAALCLQNPMVRAMIPKDVKDTLEAMSSHAA